MEEEEDIRNGSNTDTVHRALFIADWLQSAASSGPEVAFTSTTGC